MWNLLSKFAGGLFSLLLWYLQEIPSKPQTWYDNFLSKYKIQIAFCTLCLAILALLLDYLISCYKKQSSIKRWSNSFLKHIVKEHLGGRNYQTRISILRPRKGYKILIKYLIVYPLKALFSEQYRICNKSYWKNIPYKIFDNYLTIYARYGYSDDLSSYTHFLITKRGDNNGLAVKCYKEEVDSEVCTKNISKEILPKTYGEAASLIKKYMDDSFIDSKYYSTLRGMNTKANNLYAVPIFSEDQHIWGVMMIDNDSKDKTSYKKLLDQHIGMYQKIFSYTLQILK